MSAPTHESIKRRVERLERTAARYRRLAGGLAAACVGGFVVMGQSGGKDSRAIEAEQFALRDGRGIIRARWGLGQGRVSLTLADEDGKSRAGLGVTDTGVPVFVMGDARGRTRAEISVKPDGTAYVSLGDGGGRTRASLEVLAGGESGISLTDADGRKRLCVTTDSDGAPGIVLADPRSVPLLRLEAPTASPPRLTFGESGNEMRVVLGGLGEGSWGLSLLDGSGRGRSRLSVDSQGDSGLSVADKSGRTRAGLGTHADGINLLLYDRDGKSRVQLGVWPDGRPTLGLYEDNGETLWASP